MFKNITILRPRVLASLFLLTLLLTSTSFQRDSSMAHATADATTYTAYLDPSLKEIQTGSVSVIVSALDAELAASAVEQAGGTVTSKLWLIDAVGAELSADALSKVAINRSILSIVVNNKVSSAGSIAIRNDRGDDDDDDDDDDDFQAPITSHNQGWARNKNRHSASYSVRGNDNSLIAPITPLPNGGIFLITKGGRFSILDSLGNEVATDELKGGHDFESRPVVDDNGTIYLNDDKKDIYAISPTGEVLWQYQSKDDVIGEVHLQNNYQLIFIDKHGKLHALDKTTGDLNWSRQDKHVHFEIGPTLGPNGDIFIADKDGVIYSYHSDGSLNWENNSLKKKYDKAETPILMGHNGLFFIIAGDDRIIAAHIDGSIQYVYKSPEDIQAPPLVGPDNSLYIPADYYFIKLDSNGMELFRKSEHGDFEVTPQLSPDHQTVYAPTDNDYLHAIDANSGAKRWQYEVQDEIRVQPVIDSKGDIHLGDKDGIYYSLDAQGQLIIEENSGGEIKNRIQLSQDESAVFIPVQDSKINVLGMLPPEPEEEIDPDIGPAPTPGEWDYRSPVSVDIGANLVHDNLAGSGIARTGAGITIALLDSGVMSNQISAATFPDENVLDNFIGQASFSGEGHCHAVNPNVTQHADHCWANAQEGYDPFGHGTHLASIIWSELVDSNSSTTVGIAPKANILSVRVLDGNGNGSYEDLIEGIQYIIANKDVHNIRVMNISLSGYATVPYFVNPVNRAVEEAWANGIVVLAAAGNAGSGSESITVPGNDPYIITVGAIDTNGTSAHWDDDSIASWSSSGPTADGFVKPDVVAPGKNIVAYMYNDPNNSVSSAKLVKNHPDYAQDRFLYRLNGTSMSTAVASGVVALMLEENPQLTPDQVKYQLMASAQPLFDSTGQPISPLQQGAGRIWAPGAVLPQTNPPQSANLGMNIHNDLAHPWTPGDSTDPAVNPDLSYHYQGVVQRAINAQQDTYIYYATNFAYDELVVLGGAKVSDHSWVSMSELARYDYPALDATSFDLDLIWNSAEFEGSGSWFWSGGSWFWSGGSWFWSGGSWFWSGGSWFWSGGSWFWSGGLGSTDFHDLSTASEFIIDSNTDVWLISTQVLLPETPSE